MYPSIHPNAQMEGTQSARFPQKVEAEHEPTHRPGCATGQDTPCLHKSKVNLLKLNEPKSDGDDTTCLQLGSQTHTINMSLPLYKEGEIYA